MFRHDCKSETKGCSAQAESNLLLLLLTSKVMASKDFDFSSLQNNLTSVFLQKSGPGMVRRPGRHPSSLLSSTVLQSNSVCTGAL